MSVHVVIQCRTNSSRLPGKALLPIAGMPTVVLCACRAANTGLPVVVATSDDPVDDLLCAELDRYAIRYVRGSLDNVFERFLVAIKDVADDAVVVRLTADNVFPDGAFIGELTDQLHAKHSAYVSTGSPHDGLPYGMSGEAFRAGALRARATQALSLEEREHVTTGLGASQGCTLFDAGDMPHMSHVRCTVDTLRDYLHVCAVFRDVADPVREPWRSLCKRLAATRPNGFRVPYRVKAGQGILCRMTLGAAQLGLDDYGRVRAHGRVERGEAVELIRDAVEHGVTTIDCARAYGQAEAVVGKALREIGRHDVRVITKLATLDAWGEDMDSALVRDAVDASVYRSCYDLGIERLSVLMLHRWAHHKRWGGTAWSRLLELQSDGVVGELGASVYTPQEALSALAVPEIRHIQLPFNLLDKRWHEAGVPNRVSERPDVSIYARSVFLQGILLYDTARWPEVDGVDGAALVGHIDALVRKLNRADRADLCLAYVLGQDWIDSVVLGVETTKQLRDNLCTMRNAPLRATECQEVEARIPDMPEQLLNPARWPRAEQIRNP